MKRAVSVSCRKLAVTSFASVALILLMRAPVAAQGGPGSLPTGPRVDPAAARIRDEQQREMQLRGRGTEDGRADDRAVKAAAEQLNQDFKRIQVIRNDVVRALKSDAALDFKRVSGQTAEVKKRALRMQSYLALRAPADGKESEGESPYDGERVKAALVALCRRIDSFVANPRFKSPGVFDVDSTAKAARDLSEIISLSGTIRESAERLTQKNK